MRRINTEGLADSLPWERPERADQAGSFLIYGGPSGELKKVDDIFKALRTLGAEDVQAAVPESMAMVFKRAERYFTALRYEPGYKLGFEGQSKITKLVSEVDGVLILDTGKNLETQRFLAGILDSRGEHTVIDGTSDGGSLDFLINYSDQVVGNSRVSIFFDVQSLQTFMRKKAGSRLSSNNVLKSTWSMAEKAKLVAELNSKINAEIILIDGMQVIGANSSDDYLEVKIQDGRVQFMGRFMVWNNWLGGDRTLDSIFAAGNVGR